MCTRLERVPERRQALTSRPATCLAHCDLPIWCHCGRRLENKSFSRHCSGPEEELAACCVNRSDKWRHFRGAKCRPGARKPNIWSRSRRTRNHEAGNPPSVRVQRRNSAKSQPPRGKFQDRESGSPSARTTIRRSANSACQTRSGPRH